MGVAALEILGILVVCGAGSGVGRGGRVLRFVTCNNGRRGDSIFGIDVDAGSARAIDWWQMADGGVGEWEFLLCMSCFSGGWWEVVL